MAESKYVTLVSNDRFEFVVMKEAACISPVIKSMLDPRQKFKEAETGRIEFPEIGSVILEKVAEYLHYAYRNRESVDVPDMDIPPEICLELLVAADFLGLDKQPEQTVDGRVAR